jgi:hypothetical protein
MPLKNNVQKSISVEIDFWYYLLQKMMNIDNKTDKA